MRNPTPVILIIDDNRDVAAALACVLGDRGADVLVAADRAQAQAAVAQRDGCVDIILTDYELAGGADGVSVANSLLLTAPQARVLVLSGAIQRATEAAEKAGFAALAKPVKASAILDWIEFKAPHTTGALTAQN